MANRVVYTENFIQTKLKLKEEILTRADLFGQLSKQRIREEMRKSSGGEKLPGRRQASLPFSFPAKQTGSLISSIAYNVIDRGDVITIEIGSDSPYATILEFGTIKMPARPWLTLFEINYAPGLAKRLFGVPIERLSQGNKGASDSFKSRGK